MYQWYRKCFLIQTQLSSDDAADDDAPFQEVDQVLRTFRPQSTPQVSSGASHVAASAADESRSHNASADEILIDFASSVDGLLTAASTESKHSCDPSNVLMNGEEEEEQEILIIDPPTFPAFTTQSFDDCNTFDVLGLSNLSMTTNPFLADLFAGSSLDFPSDNAQTFSTFGQRSPFLSFSYATNGGDCDETQIGNGDAVGPFAAVDSLSNACSSHAGGSPSKVAPPAELNGLHTTSFVSPVGPSKGATPGSGFSDAASDSSSQCPLLTGSPLRESQSPAPGGASPSPQFDGGSALANCDAIGPLDLSLDDLLAGFSMPSPVSFSAPSIEQDFLAATNGFVSPVID